MTFNQPTNGRAQSVPPRGRAAARQPSRETAVSIVGNAGRRSDALAPLPAGRSAEISRVRAVAERSTSVATAGEDQTPEMTNSEIAEAFETIVGLLEMKGEKSFTIRAYQRAARTIDRFPRDLDAMVRAEEDLTAIPGIGKAISDKITELVSTGQDVFPPAPRN